MENNEKISIQDGRVGRYVRRHVSTTGHIRVSFNPLADPEELRATRAELLAACDHARLAWALRFPPEPSFVDEDLHPSVVPQPLLVLVPHYQQHFPEFAQFEAKYLNGEARRRHSHLMRLTFISQASLARRMFKRLQKKWQFASPFIVNQPRNFVRAEPQQSTFPTDELGAPSSRPAMRFKWRFDLTHPQNYRRWQDACHYRRIAEHRTDKDFRTDLEGTRIRRFARACDEIEAAIAAPMIEHCAAYDGYTPCHGGPFDRRDRKRRLPVVVAHVDFLLREDDFDFEPDTQNVFYRFSNALYDEILNDIARAAHQTTGWAVTRYWPRGHYRKPRWDISGGKIFEWLRHEIDDTDKMRIGKIRATIELHKERPPDHNTPLEVAQRMPSPVSVWAVELAIARLLSARAMIS